MELVPALQETMDILIKAGPVPPSNREMGEMLGVSSTAIYYRLRALEAAGLISITQGKHRGVRLTRAGKWVFVPTALLAEVNGIIAGYEARQGAANKYEGETPL